MIFDGSLYDLFIRIHFNDLKNQFTDPDKQEIGLSKASMCILIRCSLASGFRNLKIMTACVSMLKVSASM